MIIMIMFDMLIRAKSYATLNTNYTIRISVFSS